MKPLRVRHGASMPVGLTMELPRHYSDVQGRGHTVGLVAARAQRILLLVSNPVDAGVRRYEWECAYRGFFNVNAGRLGWSSRVVGAGAVEPSVPAHCTACVKHFAFKVGHGRAPGAGEGPGDALRE